MIGSLSGQKADGGWMGCMFSLNLGDELYNVNILVGWGLTKVY